MVSREKGLAAAFRTSSGTLAAPFTGVLDWCLLEGPDHSTAYGSCESWGDSGMPRLSLLLPHPGSCGGLAWGRSRMPRPSLLLPHIGSCGRLVEGAVPDAPCFSFADAVRWLRGLGAGVGFRMVWQLRGLGNVLFSSVLCRGGWVVRLPQNGAPYTRKGGQGETFGFPRFFCPPGKRTCRNHFSGGVYVGKIPRPVRPGGAHTSDRRHW